MTKKELLKKSVLQVVGLLILTFGISGIVASYAGASPFDALVFYAAAISHKLTGWGFMDQGNWTIISNVLIFLFLYLVTKNWKLIFSVIVVIVMGIFINMWLGIFGSIFGQGANAIIALDKSSLSFLNILYSFSFAGASIVFMAFGASILIFNKLFVSPYDELSLFLQKSIGKYSIAKMILDGSSFVIALILAIIFSFMDKTSILKTVTDQIFIFSIAVVLLLGPLISLFLKIFERKGVLNEVK